MDRIDLDMEDVFGERDEGAEAQTSTDHPEMPMDDAGADGAENDEEAVLANIKNLVKGAAKKRVMKPQPKLDAQRLKTNKGLPGLVKTFEGVKFKGKGHEVKDLRLMMNHLEHWGHRLFPIMTFDEYIQRLERLGVKREIKTCLSRIRLDMPVCDDDFVGTDDARLDQNDAEEEEDPEAAFDEMVRQQRDEERKKTNDEDDEFDYFDGAPVRSSNSPPPPPPALPTPPVTPGLSESQKDRAERNKMAALAKRAARLGIPLSALQSSQSTSSQPETTIVISSENNETTEQNDDQPAPSDTVTSEENMQ